MVGFFRGSDLRFYPCGQNPFLNPQKFLEKKILSITKKPTIYAISEKFLALFFRFGHKPRIGRFCDRLEDY